MPLLNNLRHRLGPVQIPQEVDATWYKGVATHCITERLVRLSFEPPQRTLVQCYLLPYDKLFESLRARDTIAQLPSHAFALADLGLDQYLSEICQCRRPAFRASIPFRERLEHTISQSRQDIDSTFEEQFEKSNLPHFHFRNHAILNTFKESYATGPSQQTAETVHRRNNPHDTYLPTKEF